MGVALGVTAIAVAGVSYGGCVVYDSSLLQSTGSASTTDVAGKCLEGRWPLPPDGGDTNGNSTIIAAFNSIDIGYRPDGGVPPFGYNLDRTCTCPGPSSCNQIPDAAVPCDDDAGRDNAAIPLFDYLGAASSAGTSQIDQGLQMGQYGLLLVISGYNNLADDPKVRVDFYVSNGLERDADGGIPTPRFDGTDRWTVDPNSLNGGQPVYTDDSAYVTQNQVVAKFGSLPVAFGDRSFLGGAQMVLTNAVIVGTLAPYTSDAGLPGFYGYQLLGGTIAGRWATSSILKTLATIPSGADGGFLCPKDSPYYYPLFKAFICYAADITKDEGSDNQGISCDAVSVGMQFTAVPAQRGNVLTVPEAPSGCMQNGEAFFDSCSSN